MKSFICALSVVFLSQCAITTPAIASELSLPGMRVSLSPSYQPLVLQGLKVHPDNPFRFDFIMDQGEATVGTNYLASLQVESTRLVKYFLASLTVPEEDLWVNLSPYEKDRIVPESFGQTEMGRDLLAQDYLLKQITASLIYPEEATGQQFWQRVYAEAGQKFGTTSIPVNTFNKVWILPDKAIVYENSKAGTAYVVESKLKVMLEEDYLASGKSISRKQGQPSGTNGQIVREIVLPALEREVNQGRNFARLRQVYNSLILATWYKKKIKDSVLSQVYADKNKISGTEYLQGEGQTLGNPEAIYQNYLVAFKKGVFNYIKDEVDPQTKQTIPRKYFSGGFGFKGMDQAMAVQTTRPSGNSKSLLSATVEVVPAQNQAMITDDSLAMGTRSLKHGARTFLLGDRYFAEVLMEMFGLIGLNDRQILEQLTPLSAKAIEQEKIFLLWLQPARNSDHHLKDRNFQMKLYWEMKKTLEEFKVMQQGIVAATEGHREIQALLKQTNETLGARVLRASLKFFEDALLQMESRVEFIEQEKSKRTFELNDFKVYMEEMFASYPSNVLFSAESPDLEGVEIEGNLYTLASALYNIINNPVQMVEQQIKNIRNRIANDKLGGKRLPAANTRMEKLSQFKVEVNFARKDGQLYITVTDNLGGIPEHLMVPSEATGKAVMFDLDRTTKESTGGTGLGTTEALKAVQLLGGDLNVVNYTKTVGQKVVKGARFTINTPIADGAMTQNEAILKPERREGGIDFKSDRLFVVTRNSQGQIQMKIDPAMLRQLQNVVGFQPKVLQIAPMADLTRFLETP